MGNAGLSAVRREGERQSAGKGLKICWEMTMLKTYVEHCKLIAEEVVSAPTALSGGDYQGLRDTENFLEEEGFGGRP